MLKKMVFIAALLSGASYASDKEDILDGSCFNLVYQGNLREINLDSELNKEGDPFIPKKSGFEKFVHKKKYSNAALMAVGMGSFALGVMVPILTKLTYDTTNEYMLRNYV